MSKTSPHESSSLSWRWLPYFRCGRTMAQYGRINAASDKSSQDQRKMKSNRLFVFAASLQCTGEVKVVSSAARSRTSVTWGVWWLASAPEKDGKMGGYFPAVRHEHSLGLIGRSHSPAQAQTNKGSREGDFIRFAGKPFSCHLQKGKQNHREWKADHLFITEKVTRR